ncbi:Ger(x)C family spore germination protein [Cytobacillus sp. IB215665]|uniref:Ger(x)C family spore germination protein n=1 Tax=Cytobacillus sp. IB215665 TaxID=3097357 RepID=UPI002A1429A1|nr:Ger(x)C family spore germination protein [Cytobacillus sp. IB215665]MDX8365739.1 Ger(x)C family spore germination protein [Cytobacillus sp. IB215665]
MRNIFFVTICIVILSGCYSSYGIDDLAMINAIGYDLSEEEDAYLDVTALYPRATETGNVFETLQASGNSTKDIEIDTMAQSSFEIVNGQLEIMLFGDELAKEGILPIIHTALRDPSIGSRVKLAVTKGKADQIITKKLEKEPNLGLYLDTMLNKFEKTFVFPSVNLYQFSRSYFDDGIDPFLPVFSATSNNIEFDSFALFNEDKLITTISRKQAVYLFFLRENFRKGLLDIDLMEGDIADHIHLSYVRNKHKIHITKKEDDHFSVEIDIHVTGSLEEYTGDLNIEEPKEQKKLEKIIKELVDKETMAVMEFLQKNNVDVIGLGQKIRNSLTYEEWKSLDWDKVYPEIDVTIKSDVKIRNIGKFNQDDVSN